MRLYKSTMLASLLLGRKAMTNLDSILISRNITLPTKVHIVKAMVFSVVMYGCELLFSCSVVADCNPMDYSMPGFPVLHHLPEFAQIHVRWVGDAIQTSCPLSSPSSPTFSLSQHQGLFQWVSSSNQVAKVLELQLQHQSVLPMNIQDWFPLGWTGWIPLQSKRLSRVFSSTTVQKHQFFSTQPFLWSSFHIHKGLLAKP